MLLLYWLRNKTYDFLKGWLGAYEKSPSHGEAMAYLLKVAALREWQSTFDADLVLTLCIPVVRDSYPKLTWMTADNPQDLREYRQSKNPTRRTILGTCGYLRTP